MKESGFLGAHDLSGLDWGLGCLCGVQGRSRGRVGSRGGEAGARLRIDMPC